PSAARPAATPARTPPAAPASTSPPPALPAAARPGFPLSPSPTVLSTAASALLVCVSSSNLHNKNARRRCAGRFLLPGAARTRGKSKMEEKTESPSCIIDGIRIYYPYPRDLRR